MIMPWPRSSPATPLPPVAQAGAGPPATGEGQEWQHSPQPKLSQGCRSLPPEPMLGAAHRFESHFQKLIWFARDVPQCAGHLDAEKSPRCTIPWLLEALEQLGNRLSSGRADGSKCVGDQASFDDVVAARQEFDQGWGCWCRCCSEVLEGVEDRRPHDFLFIAKSLDQRLDRQSTSGRNLTQAPGQHGCGPLCPRCSTPRPRSA